MTRALTCPLSGLLLAPLAAHAEELGIHTVKMSSAEFGSFVAKQINDWAPAIKAADVKN